MAQFTNQAQLSYNGGVVNSNVAVGELLEVVSATKIAVMDDYTRGDEVTYVISGINSGATAVTGLTITDDLGTYAFGDGVRTPLSYVDGSVNLFINGTLSPAPTVTVQDNAVVFGGITLPANSNLILIYEAAVNLYAPLDVGASIVNTATVTGSGIPTPVTVSETVSPEETPDLTITKSIEPVPVAENGTLTYRFIIQNYGNTPADVGDNVAVTDTFDPVLTGLVVTFNGESWTEGTQYNYTPATGLFATVPGQITVPAATYEQDPTTGAWITTPGVSILTVTGTV